MIDTQIIWLSVGAFILITVALSALILLFRYVFVPKGTCLLHINEDPSLTKQVDLGQTLLIALTKSGIAIPSPCGGRATCKQCKVRVVEGAQPPMEIEEATFSRAQLNEGWRLSCQCKVMHDMGVRLEDRYLQAKSYTATVISNKNVATFIKEVHVAIPKENIFSYKPGSYMEVLIPPFETNTTDWKKTIAPEYWNEWEKYGMWDTLISFHSSDGCKRAYSLGSYSLEQEHLLFVVRIATPPFVDKKVASDVPWGIGSSYIFSLKEGDTITIVGPYGESFMKDTDQDVYFLIGGAGASFGRSHIFDLLLHKKSQRHVELWYGARSLKENIYEKEFRELEEKYKNFSYHLVLSEPTTEDIASGWPKNDPLKTGFLFSAFDTGCLQKLDTPEKALFYVCGPPMHNKSVMHLLDSYGVPKEHIVLDDFG